nr:MAG TPA: hypothetical protein [Caudoviricetes sp.]
MGSSPTSAAILHIPCCILEPGKSYGDFPLIWNDSLRGLSGGLKNRRMMDRYHLVPP